MVIYLKIIRDFESEIYSKNNRLLGNCFTLIIDKIKYYFEFEINNNQAKIIMADKMQYILNVIDEFRKYNKYVNVFYNNDNSFYKSFDEIYTFKLPINIIQPSKFFIDKDRLDVISNILEDKEVFIPVTILNDEYVCVDGHTRLLAKSLEDNKMVNCYMTDLENHIDDLVYMAKEQNIRNVNKMIVLNHEEYNKYWIEFLNSLYE